MAASSSYSTAMELAFRGAAGTETKSAEMSKVVENLVQTIIEGYDAETHTSVKAYLGAWKGRIKTYAKNANIKLINTEDPWIQLYENLGGTEDTTISDTPPTEAASSFKRPRITSSPSRASSEVPSEASSEALSEASSVASSQKATSSTKLSDTDKQRVINLYKSIPNGEKWHLKSKKVVEDVMAKLAETLTYEHPVHSLILDPEDTTWNGHFSEADLEEIRAYKEVDIPNLPEDLQKCLNDFAAKERFTTGAELLDYARKMEYDPIQQPDLHWVERSTYDLSHLFLQTNALSTDQSEAEALHYCWSFCYTLCNHGIVQARLGERVSTSVALGRNLGREMATSAKRQRKTMGAKVDILFRATTTELGCCEVGKLNVAPVDTKYIEDGFFKMPKTLRDMLATLFHQRQSALGELTTVGYLLMGTRMQLVMMDFPHNLYISRVTRSADFDFPMTIFNVASSFPALLSIAWKGKAVMTDTFSKLTRRKASMGFQRETVRLPAYSFNKDT